ncbi:MAG: RNA polymerase sigma factor [Nitrospirae bacterium]|nr:RNA polymerase sigma factor [Nitrospirota bacterium]
MSTNEAELIKSVRQGNMTDFTPLVEKYQTVVYGLAFSLVGDFSTAQDIAQETFITAYKKLNQLRCPEKFPGWLKRITLNTARMWLRKRKEIPFNEGEEEKCVYDQPVAAEGTEGKEFREEIMKLINSLSEKARLPVMLCYLDDIPYKEAAKFLGIQENTLRKRLHDVKGKLQKQIVEIAGRTLQEHRLPRDFASRCICGCERSKKAKKKGVKKMSKKKKPNKEQPKAKTKSCGCGCISGKNKKTT